MRKRGKSEGRGGPGRREARPSLYRVLACTRCRRLAAVPRELGQYRALAVAGWVLREGKVVCEYCKNEEQYGISGPDELVARARREGEREEGQRTKDEGQGTNERSGIGDLKSEISEWAAGRMGAAGDL